jgi:hypothetical protein
MIVKFLSKSNSRSVFFLAGSRVTVGTKSGFSIYTCDPFKRVAHLEGGASIVEVFFNSMLVAHVGDGESAVSSQRVLRMINTKREKEIIRMNYNTKILAVKLNRLRLIVVLESHIHIYDVRNMRLAHTIGPTPRNPHGMYASSCIVTMISTTMATTLKSPEFVTSSHTLHTNSFVHHRHCRSRQLRLS